MTAIDAIDGSTAGSGCCCADRIVAACRLTKLKELSVCVQVQPKTPIQTFSVRLNDDLARDPRRILQSFPNGTLSDYGPNGRRRRTKGHANAAR